MTKSTGLVMKDNLNVKINNSNEFYSYRKIKNKFDRVRSIGVLENSQSISIDNKVVNITDRKYKLNSNSNKHKEVQMFNDNNNKDIKRLTEK